MRNSAHARHVSVQQPTFARIRITVPERVKGRTVRNLRRVIEFIFAVRIKKESSQSERSSSGRLQSIITFGCRGPHDA